MLCYLNLVISIKIPFSPKVKNSEKIILRKRRIHFSIYLLLRIPDLVLLETPLYLFRMNSPTIPLLQPVEFTNRIYFIDALRGFAILGIFIANLPFFAGVSFMDDAQLAASNTAVWDQYVRTFEHIFVEAKFYSLFSLLFGIGFGLQWMRAQTKGVSFVPFFSRRLGWLLLIGFIHLTFWIGDILFLYAMTGFALLLFRNMNPRNLLLWAISLLLMPILWDTVKWASEGDASLAWLLFGAGRFLDTYFGNPEEIIDILKLEGFIPYIKGNLAGMCYRYGDLIYTGRFYKVFAMFLVGFWLVKSGWLETWQDRKASLRKVLIIGLVIGIPANVGVMLIGESINGYAPVGMNVLKTFLHAIGVAPLCLAYAAGLALIWLARREGGFLRHLVPVGRMALSNYLLQTTIGITVFYGVGAGYVGQVGSVYLLLMALGVFAIQTVLSALWLRRFRFGPAEWLWRSLSYGKRQPWR